MPYMPNRWAARIEPAKILWLLTKTHARDFAHFGVTLGNAAWLESVLLDIAHSAEYVSTAETEHGVKYQYYEWARTPEDVRIPLVSSWIARYGSEIPLLVTSYPQSRPYKGKRL